MTIQLNLFKRNTAGRKKGRGSWRDHEMYHL
jgi:hypothetical protein